MKIVKTKDVRTPERGTSRSAGLDFFVPNGVEPIKLQPGESTLIKTGIIAQVPKGFGLFVKNKSSVATNKSLIVGACVVDEDYQGEIAMHLINVGLKTEVITSGDKLVQMVLLPVNYEGIEVVGSFGDLHKEQTERGAGGFGSTDKKETFDSGVENILAGVETEKEDIRSYNVGTSDYSKRRIQPWDIWQEYDLNPRDADIVKRVLRNKSTDSRRLDYEKVIHICKERIRQIDELN